jgi:hypothetical protein
MTRDPPRSISLFCCLFFGSVHQGPARRDPELGPWAPPLPRPDLSPRTGLLLGPSAAVCSGGGRSGASLVGSPMAPVGVPPPAPLQLNGCAVPTLPEAPQTRPGKLASRPNQRPTRRFRHPPEPRGDAPDDRVRLGRARVAAAHRELFLAQAPGSLRWYRRPVPHASALASLGRGQLPRPGKPTGRKPLQCIVPGPSLVSSAALASRPKSSRRSNVRAGAEAGRLATLVLLSSGRRVSAIT